MKAFQYLRDKRMCPVSDPMARKADFKLKKTIKFLTSSSTISTLSRARYRECNPVENIADFICKAFHRRRIINNCTCSSLFIQKRTISVNGIKVGECTVDNGKYLQLPLIIPIGAINIDLNKTMLIRMYYY